MNKSTVGYFAVVAVTALVTYFLPVDWKAPVGFFGGVCACTFSDFLKERA